MKIAIKILITLTTLIILPISIYYGLRFRNTPFVFEYINRSYVITLPNKVWFEIDGGKDMLDEEVVFSNDTPQLIKEGIDIGPRYPKYTVITKNNIAQRTQIANRVGDTIGIELKVDTFGEEYEEYITNIYFSQSGTFDGNTYIQEGCEVEVEADNGDISFNEEFAIISITNNVLEGKVEDSISINISCK